jgi:hypothetical protein
MDPVVVGHKDEWRHFSPIAVAPNLVIFAKKREFFLHSAFKPLYQKNHARYMARTA